MGKLALIVCLAVVLTPVVRSVELLEEVSLQGLDESSEPVVLQETPRTEKLLKFILGDIFSNYEPKPKPKPTKRTCYFNGGMAHNCDYSDVVKAARHDKFWRDPDMPGRKRRSPRLPFKKRVKRCANLLDDSCINGQYPGSGGDGDYFGSGGSPGKRSLPPLMEIFKNQMANQGKLKRCVNLFDDSCINSQYPGSGGDGDYFASGGSPGKRSAAPLVMIYQNKMDNKGKMVRRCANLLDDSCINGQYPGSGGDGDYFGSGGSPGKRSLSIEQILNNYCLRGHAASCRLLRK